MFLMMIDTVVYLVVSVFSLRGMRWASKLREQMRWAFLDLAHECSAIRIAIAAKSSSTYKLRAKTYKVTHFPNHQWNKVEKICLKWSL
jgi:uncharacterized lipoprotein YmbA